MRHGGRYELIFSLMLVIPFLSGEVLPLMALQGMLGPTGLLNGALMRTGTAPLRFIMASNTASERDHVKFAGASGGPNGTAVEPSLRYRAGYLVFSSTNSKGFSSPPARQRTLIGGNMSRSEGS